MDKSLQKGVHALRDANYARTHSLFGDPEQLAIRLDAAGQLTQASEAAPQLTTAVVGLGYVGLPTSLALLAHGVRVIGLEISQRRIDAIRSKAVDLTPADHERLGSALESDDFLMTTDVAALRDADAVIVCVPTPIDEHLAPDLTALTSACKNVTANAVEGQTIILTSTSYVGCTRDLVVTPLEARGLRVGQDVFVAYSPERIDPGTTAFTQEAVTRVVGGVTPACLDRAVDVVGRIAPVHRVSSPEVAELTKLHENTFRAVNIALANQLESVSELFGLEVGEVIDAAATKPFGFMPFRPGTGVGGHCIPCDPHYLLWQLRRERVTAPLIDQAMTDIALRPLQIVDRAVRLMSDHGRGLRGARVLVVGAAYKAAVQDVRESPAIEILSALRDRGAVVEYIDPLVPSLRMADGSVMLSVRDLVVESYDVVIVHVLQPGFDWRVLAASQLIVDPGSQMRKVLGAAAPRPDSIQVRESSSVEAAPVQPVVRRRADVDEGVLATAASR